MAATIRGGAAPSFWNVVAGSSHSSSHLFSDLSKLGSDLTMSLTINTSETLSPMEEEPKPDPLPSPKMLNQQDLNQRTHQDVNPQPTSLKQRKFRQYEIQLPVMVQHIQYMQDHALICKFMGLCSSKKALLWWIKTRWNPKGNVDLKLGSKGFFTTIFNLTKIEKGYSRMAPIFLTRWDYTCASGKRISSLRRNILQQPRYGFVYIPSLKNTSTPRSWKVLEIHWDPLSEWQMPHTKEDTLHMPRYVCTLMCPRLYQPQSASDSETQSGYKQLIMNTFLSVVVNVMPMVTCLGIFL
jgi:hypothetical protein